MTKVFIGGSRRVGRLDQQVKARLNSIVERQFLVLVGDANGADKAVQRHLRDRGYRNVEVYCVAGDCRNNLGEWRLRAVTPDHTKRDLAYFASKDREMAREANVGFMIWDGKSAGTLLNVFRLVNGNKRALVYNVPASQFVKISERADLDELLSNCPPQVRRKVAAQLESERPDGSRERQSSLL